MDALIVLLALAASAVVARIGLVAIGQIARLRVSSGPHRPWTRRPAAGARSRSRQAPPRTSAVDSGRG